MSETQRFGLCAGVVDDASASEAHSKTLPGGRAPAVAKAGARDGFQDLVGASGEAAQDSILFGAARSGVSIQDDRSAARVPRRGVGAQGGVTARSGWRTEL